MGQNDPRSLPVQKPELSVAVLRFWIEAQAANLSYITSTHLPGTLPRIRLSYMASQLTAGR